MRFRLLPIAVVVMALAALAATPAEARHRGRRSDDRRPRVVVVDRSPRVVVPQYRSYYRPYGWSRGNKVGWGNCDLPPGLAKKYGCHCNYYYDRRVYRRPAIVIPLPYF